MMTSLGRGRVSGTGVESIYVQKDIVYNDPKTPPLGVVGPDGITSGRIETYLAPILPRGRWMIFSFPGPSLRPNYLDTDQAPVLVVQTRV